MFYKEIYVEISFNQNLNKINILTLYFTRGSYIFNSSDDGLEKITPKS